MRLICPNSKAADVTVNRHTSLSVTNSDRVAKLHVATEVAKEWESREDTFYGDLYRLR
jgi:hypothetical protein